MMTPSPASVPDPGKSSFLHISRQKLPTATLRSSLSPFVPISGDTLFAYDWAAAWAVPPHFWPTPGRVNCLNTGK